MFASPVTYLLSTLSLSSLRRHPQLSSLECRVSELESQRDVARDGADTLTQEVDALKTMLKAAQEGTDNGCESGGRAFGCWRNGEDVSAGEGAMAVPVSKVVVYRYCECSVVICPRQCVGNFQ